jgi:hypothetical protein
LNLEPRSPSRTGLWNLEPGTPGKKGAREKGEGQRTTLNLELRTSNLEPGTLNLEPGTPGKKGAREKGEGQRTTLNLEARTRRMKGEGRRSRVEGREN